MENKLRVTQGDILRGREELGIRPGDVVYAHSSLSAFGYVDGGADAVVDALLAAAGPEGTVALPAFTWERNHAKAVVVFDVANDPSEAGRITEVFRRRPSAVRNEHVCHSTAAPVASSRHKGPDRWTGKTSVEGSYCPHRDKNELTRRHMEHEDRILRNRMR